MTEPDTTGSAGSCKSRGRGGRGLALFIPVGVAIGASLGAATGDMGLWLALGVAIGAALGAATEARS